MHRTQIAFIENVVRPLFEVMTHVMPELQVCAALCALSLCVLFWIILSLFVTRTSDVFD